MDWSVNSIQYLAMKEVHSTFLECFLKTAANFSKDDEGESAYSRESTHLPAKVPREFYQQKFGRGSEWRFFFTHARALGPPRPRPARPAAARQAERERSVHLNIRP